MLVLILPSASWKHQLCIRMLQEPEAWMTSMDSPVWSGHVVVISWFLIGASVFGVWKTGDMLNPVVRVVTGAHVSLASWKLLLCVGTRLWVTGLRDPDGAFRPLPRLCPRAAHLLLLLTCA